MSETSWSRERLLEVMNGFRPACLLGAAAELDLWTQLGEVALTAQQLAQRLGCDLRALTMLLDALAALHLLDKREDVYSVPLAIRAWLTAGAPQTVLPMLQHSMNTLRGWSQLAWVAKCGMPFPRPASIRGPIADRESFIAAMHAVSGPVADELVGRLGPPPFRRMLDVGGASGTWTLAFLRARPTASAVIFDLPDAIHLARQRLADSPFAERVELVAGDFYRDDLPGSVDFAWVSAICHQHSRAENRTLFAKVCAALLSGGRIAVRDVVMEPCRTKPLHGAMFALNMLVNTERGGTFTFDEYTTDLEAAGFVRPRLVIKDEAMNSVIIAEKA